MHCLCCEQNPQEGVNIGSMPWQEMTMMWNRYWTNKRREAPTWVEPLPPTLSPNSSAEVSVIECRPLCGCKCICPHRPGKGGRRPCPGCNRLIGPGCCWDHIRKCYHKCADIEPEPDPEPLILGREYYEFRRRLWMHLLSVCLVGVFRRCCAILKAKSCFVS